MSLLAIRNLDVRYGAVAAVVGASLEVGQGEVVGILGPNGAGKSTMLAAVAGLVRAVAGSVHLDGRDLGRLGPDRRARSGIVLVVEGRGVLGPMTVAENLELGAYPGGRQARSELAARLEEAYELFPVLRERAAQPAGVLSGGEAAMLVVARGLMSRPRILLLDEPALGLAPRTASDLFARLGELKSAGTTMVIVEQKAADLLAVADRVAVMRGGRIVRTAASSDVNLEDLQQAYLGPSTEADLAINGRKLA
ncbi:MAG: transporter [Solirubrobacterales bacterium]|nr:transporter [Solirubrobacterales bacterium]